MHAERKAGGFFGMADAIVLRAESRNEPALGVSVIHVAGTRLSVVALPVKSQTGRALRCAPPGAASNHQRVTATLR